MAKEHVRFQSWIDTQVIEDACQSALKGGGVKVTNNNLKTLWLNFLGTELGQGLKSCIEYAPINWEK